MQLAEANRFDGIPALMKFFKFTFNELLLITDNSLAMLIANATGPLEFNYKGMHPKILNIAKNQRRFGLVVESRVCPVCIKENFMQSVSFNSSMPVTCPRHGILPIDFCPKCNSALTYLRKSPYLCDCGYLLENSPTLERPTWLTTLYAIFAPWHLTSTNVERSENRFFERDYEATQLILYVANYFKSPRMATYINSKDFYAINLMISDFPDSVLRQLEKIDKNIPLKTFFRAPSPTLTSLKENQFLSAIINNYLDC